MLRQASCVLALFGSSLIHRVAAQTFVAPADFPTSLFSNYYYGPAPTQEPQPKIFDPVLNFTYPLNLTDPRTIPTLDTTDPIFYPVPVANLSTSAAEAFIQTAINQIVDIILDGTSFPTNCTKCTAALSVAKVAAQTAPSLVPGAMVKLCQMMKLTSNATCELDYEPSTFGAIWTTVLAYADVAGQDGEYICNHISSDWCPKPTYLGINTTGIFPKPKPANAVAPPASGKRIKVLQVSDIHLDPRFGVGAEAECTTAPCCRFNQHNNSLPTGDIALPASRYGSYKCDSPYFLTASALEAIAPLTGTGPGTNSSFAWSIYTGDSQVHDPENQNSRLYLEYAETSVYGMLKSAVNTPWYVALGNHDTRPEGVDAPHSLPGNLGTQMGWNFDHVAGLWEDNGWINSSVAAEARLHYGGYSVKTPDGLRIITFNTDFWYTENLFNFINTSNPDNSGMFKFMVEELQAAEDAGERVWILGHVLSGWDGSNPMPGPTDLFYQIVDRYSPHVIANVMFAHTHEDEQMIYYANNGTNMSAETALTPGWIMPSITPLTNLNSGFRYYEVDTGDYNIYEAYTYYADVNSFPSLNSTGPTWQFEYSTRDAYPVEGWSSDAPLNATWWHFVTEAMESNRSLVTQQNTYQSKMSIKGNNCTSEACTTARICYIRSGSGPIGSQCPQGFASNQSPFTGKNY